MNLFQVTARFDNVWDVVGDDTVNRAEADRLARIFHNTGRDVCVHQIEGAGSRVAYELVHINTRPFPTH